ncbi:hypothetical protein BGAL_0095g00100 [Botrytis galanthina]|uniref:Uncharacterized protein n=1 Tax=Botrytis galanthina TaxID=278940 RepID=A0A4S8REJ0_9HELO|nr:hypothetical protein BGAL_0095g00100 [Botrytis galanthina]
MNRGNCRIYYFDSPSNITQKIETCPKYLPKNLAVDASIFAIHGVDRHFTKSVDSKEEMAYLRLIKKIPVIKFFEVFIGKLWFDAFFTVGHIYNVR